MNELEILKEMVPTKDQNKTANVTISLPKYLLAFIDSLVENNVQASRSAFMSQACFDFVFKLMKLNEWFESCPQKYTRFDLFKPQPKSKEKELEEK